ncbi:MAG: hypothetical protein Q4D70_08900, partial [bacterium]|nr:hypothetical protein [bacterium]
MHANTDCLRLPLLAGCLVSTLVVGAATVPDAPEIGPLTVEQAEVVEISHAQTNSTVEVHGALSVVGETGGGVVRLVVTNTLTVGRASGDRATVTVGDEGQIMMGRLPLTIGGPDGAGLVTLGGRRPGNIPDGDARSYNTEMAHLFCGDISVPADATAASG